MSRNVWRPFLAVGCAGHRNAAKDLSFVPRESECEVDVRNPSATEHCYERRPWLRTGWPRPLATDTFA